MIHQALLAVGLLIPHIAELLDLEALVVGIVAGTMTVRFEPYLGTATVEHEFFILAHIGVYTVFLKLSMGAEIGICNGDENAIY